MWREPDGVQKARAGDTGIGQGYNHHRMEASPNTHLPLSLHFICHPLTSPFPPPPHFSSLHLKPTIPYPHQLISLTYNTSILFYELMEL